jgi:hypothetical protein
VQRNQNVCHSQGGWASFGLSANDKNGEMGKCEDFMIQNEKEKSQIEIQIQIGRPNNIHIRLFLNYGPSPNQKVVPTSLRIFASLHQKVSRGNGYQWRADDGE